MSARLLAIGVLLAACSCGGGLTAPATQRLWVSALPTSPKASLTAFLTVRADDGNYFGSFYRGSLLRGNHDAIRWQPVSEREVKLTFLQDDTSRTVRLESCKPDKGFHHCVRLVGGPYGVEKYQSRKRWVVSVRASHEPLGEQLADVIAQDEDLRDLVAHWP